MSTCTRPTRTAPQLTGVWLASPPCFRSPGMVEINGRAYAIALPDYAFHLGQEFTLERENVSHTVTMSGRHPACSCGRHRGRCLHSQAMAWLRRRGLI